MSRSRGRRNTARRPGSARRPATPRNRPAASPPAEQPAAEEPSSVDQATTRRWRPSPSLVRVMDVALRAAGLLIALTLAFLIAVIGALLTPYRIGTTLVPISLLIAAAGVIGTIWFAHEVTGHRVVAMLPGAVWLVVSLFASSRTSEGDLILISSNWVAAGYLLAGPIAIAACGYWLFFAQRRRS